MIVIFWVIWHDFREYFHWFFYPLTGFRPVTMLRATLSSWWVAHGLGCIYVEVNSQN